MKKVLLSFVALAAGAAMAIAQDEAVYPSELDFTLNGEKELSGVNVTQTITQYDGAPLLTIKITGECDADAIQMDFVTPEGWDYATTSIMLDGGNSPFMTRSGDLWLPLNRLDKNYKKGNSFNFPVDGKENFGTIYLVKGDSFWSNSIDIEMNVTKVGGTGNDQPDDPRGDMPEYPESLNITLNGEKELPGVTVTQTMEPYDDDADNLTIYVKGTSNADFITIDFPTPAGWDYMLVGVDFSDEDEETEALKAKAPALENDDYWMPASMAQWFNVAPGNSITFPVNGDEIGGRALLVKGEDAYMVSIDFVFQVSKADGPDVPGDDDLVIPDHLDYTLNGEAAIPGVTVRQLIDESAQIFSVTGECDYDQITITFDTPKGWDGLMIADAWGEGEINTVKTRSVELIPVADILGQGFVEGNSITYKTDGEAQWGQIALIKGDMAWSTHINYDFTVSKGGGSDVPGDEPVFPESVGVTAFPDEGIEVEQHNEDGTIFIDLFGETTEDTFDVVLDVPEGWTGFVSMPDSEDVIVGDYVPGPRMAKAQEAEWVPIVDVLEDGIFLGNKFTFKANGARQLVQICLYKDELVDVANSIILTANVNKKTSLDPELAAANQAAYESVIAELDALQEKYEAAVAEIKENNPDFDFTEWEEIASIIDFYKEGAAQALSGANEEGESFFYPFDGEEIDAYIAMMIMAATPAPVIPEKYDVTFNGQASFDLVETTQGYDQGVYTIKVTGMSLEKELTVTLGVPEGWDGYVSMNEDDFNSEIDPLSTRAEETEWYPIEYMLLEGLKESNSMTFPVDGEDHYGRFYLVKDGLADVANMIVVEFNVSDPSTVGVSGVEAINSDARYYDINGRQIANPAAGMYIKILNGKATKVVVK